MKMKKQREKEGRKGRKEEKEGRKGGREEGKKGGESGVKLTYSLNFSALSRRVSAAVIMGKVCGCVSLCECV